MPRKPGLDARGMRPRRHWPRLTTDEQETIRNYLAWWKANADHAQSRTIELSNVSAEPGLYAGAVTYWGHVSAGIDWLLHQLPKKQEYLECLRAMQAGTFVPSPISPATSSGPVVPKSSFGPTDPPAADGRGGRPRKGHSGKRSRPPKPTA